LAILPWQQSGILASSELEIARGL